MWIRGLVLCGIMLAAGLGVHAQEPPPTQSERTLQEKLDLTDGKPTQAQPEAGPSGWRALGSMLLVLGLAGGSLWAFRKWGAKKFPGSGGSRLNVEETLALGDRRFVAILRADDDKFLIAMSPQGVTLLARIDSVEAAGPTEFAQALERQGDIATPMAVRDVEAMMRGDRP